MMDNLGRRRDHDGVCGRCVAGDDDEERQSRDGQLMWRSENLLESFGALERFNGQSRGCKADDGERHLRGSWPLNASASTLLFAASRSLELEYMEEYMGCTLYQHCADFVAGNNYKFGIKIVYSSFYLFFLFSFCSIYMQRALWYRIASLPMLDVIPASLLRSTYSNPCPGDSHDGGLRLSVATTRN